MVKFRESDYRIYLKNSIMDTQNKHILVEGKDDKYLIQRLWADFWGQNSIFKIRVDSAEDFIELDGKNNRQKVEFITESINGKPYADSFVGFIDRELHKFEWDSEIKDLIESHEVIQRLVLSRGHSIENYIFDFSILYEVFECLSTTPYASKAIQLFQEYFDLTLRLACSIGLAATKAQILTKAKSTIDYKLLEITSTGSIEFDFESWVQKLIDDRKVSDVQVQDIKRHHATYIAIVSRASISLVRWICHGHIGYEFLTALYERCIFNSCPSIEDSPKEVSEISWAKKKLFYSFINAWIKKSLQNQCEYPTAIFELLR